MQRLLLGVYRYLSQHRWLMWTVIVIWLFTFLYTISQIRFEQSIEKIMPQNEAFQTLQPILENTAQQQMVFAIGYKDSSLANNDSLIFWQKKWINHIQAHTNESLVFNSEVQNDLQDSIYQTLLNNLPLFYTEQDYQYLDSILHDSLIAQKTIALQKNLQGIGGALSSGFMRNDPIGILKPLHQKLLELRDEQHYTVEDGHLFNAEKTFLFFFLPQSKKHNTQTAKLIDKASSEFQAQHPQLQLYYFGAPLVAQGNQQQLQTDTILTLSITVLLLLALTTVIFKKIYIPLLLFLPVLFGAALGLIVCYFYQGEIFLIALGAGALVLGIAIDFSIHFISHATQSSSIEKSIADVAYPLTIGAITTIGAFGILLFAEAPLLQQIGLFAACSLLGASLFTLIFLPHFIPTKLFKNNNRSPHFIEKIAAYPIEKKTKWVLVILLLTPAFYYFSKHVKFEDDLLQLNYLSPQLSASQDFFNQQNASGLSSLFIVAKDEENDKAKQKLEQEQPLLESFLDSNWISSYQIGTTFLPSKHVQQERLLRWQNFWESQREQMLKTMDATAQSIGLPLNALDRFKRIIQNPFTPLSLEEEQTLHQLAPHLNIQNDSLNYVVGQLKITPGNRAKILQHLQTQSQVEFSDRQGISEMLLKSLHIDFDRLILYSGLFVFIALLIAYGRIELALIAFLPMAISWIWVLGCMHLLGISFNIVNIIVATLIFGLGDDYAIFMMDGLIQKYKTGHSKLKQARVGIYLSIITTIIGLGTLIFAKHPALYSIALVSIIGLISVLIVSQILQPFLFNILIQNRADKGRMPFTLWSLIKSVFSFAYFFLGCLITTILGFVLIYIRPFGKRRSKYIFHFILSNYTKSVMYIMANVTKKVIITTPEAFKQPAVYIANHASFLDILLTTMLHPKLVLLTTKWVWKSPAFGKIVQMAGYYPVAEGAEDSIEPLRKTVAEGYGIVVFPEGTRSDDDTIHRFHKGAFYIAEQLNLPIIPIVLHGVNYTMEKGDFLLKDGTTTVKLDHYFPADNHEMGENYTQKTKSFNKWFRQRLDEEKVLNETPTYFREQLVKGNLYKGPILEWYCKVKVALEKNYDVFHTLLPRSGKFYDVGCGYGFMTMLLQWSAPERHFTGVDYDEEKITTAQHHYIFNKEKRLAKKERYAHKKIKINLQFEYADVTNYAFEACNGIIISDVLHYLNPEQQTELLNKSYSALLPDGKLIIRDGVKELKQRHKGTQLTELFSTRIIGFNQTSQPLHFLSKEFLANWAAEKNLSMEIIDTTKTTSNLIFVFSKRTPEVS